MKYKKSFYHIRVVSLLLIVFITINYSNTPRFKVYAGNKVGTVDKLIYNDTVTVGDLKYRLVYVGQYKGVMVTGLTSKAKKKVKTLTISATINVKVKSEKKTYEFEVYDIKDYAFKNNKKITKVKLGKNVKFLGKGSFEGCSKLKTVTLANDSELIQIYPNCFKNCKKLSRFNTGNLEVLKYIPKNAFKNTKIKKLSKTIAVLNKSGVGYGVLAEYKGIKFARAYSDYRNGICDDSYEKITSDFINSEYKPAYNHYEIKIYVSSSIDPQYLYIKYKGDEGYRDIGDYDKQYIPDYSNPAVSAYISYNDKSPEYSMKNGEFMNNSEDYVTRYDYMKKEGFAGYINIVIQYTYGGKQNFDLYYKDKKITTITSDKDSIFSGGTGLTNNAHAKSVLNDIQKYKTNMTDFDILSASQYWYRNHSYDDYTCWACMGVANIMKMKGYPAWILSCSKVENGYLVQDYENYYSLSSKGKGGISLGHRIALVRIDSSHCYFVEVQGSYELKAGETDFSIPWIPENYSDSISVNEKCDWLRDYDSIYDMMKGDYGIDIVKFDPYDCKTWY